MGLWVWSSIHDCVGVWTAHCWHGVAVVQEKATPRPQDNEILPCFVPGTERQLILLGVLQHPEKDIYCDDQCVHCPKHVSERDGCLSDDANIHETLNSSLTIQMIRVQLAGTVRSFGNNLNFICWDSF